MFRYRHILIALLLVLCVFPAGAQELQNKTDFRPDASSTFTRMDITFPSQGDQLKAWLYLPSGPAKPPVIVMAHGFGGERWMRLPAYAEQFAQNGMAVFLFDYRGFNDSEGKPRNYVNPGRHLQDWDAAIAYVKKLSSVDAGRMALWGTSFSGGHVIVEAAKHPEVRAVVSQVPFTDGLSTQWHYFITEPLLALKGTGHGLADVLASVFTENRHNVRIAGRPGEAFAMMSKKDTMPGLLKLLALDEKEFEKNNFCPANIVFTLGLYRPIGYAKKVACPALVIGAERDTLFPPDGPRKMADRMKKATYISLPVNHFDPYVGEPFDKLVKVMSDFLKAHLM